jgi:CBS domain containing-hemolysin-like protein
MTIDNFKKLYLKEGYTRVPVLKENKVIGILDIKE